MNTMTKQDFINLVETTITEECKVREARPSKYNEGFVAGLWYAFETMNFLNGYELIKKEELQQQEEHF